jgi:hypothetical protein
MGLLSVIRKTFALPPVDASQRLRRNAIAWIILGVVVFIPATALGLWINHLLSGASTAVHLVVALGMAISYELPIGIGIHRLLWGHPQGPQEWPTWVRVLATLLVLALALRVLTIAVTMMIRVRR